MYNNSKQLKKKYQMKITLLLLLVLISSPLYGQRYSEIMNSMMTAERWENESKTNIALLPKYGYKVKTDEQKKSDQEFLDEVLKQYPSRQKASEEMVKVGFSYLFKDKKTAMYRFNQAYLLDSTNSDIYWGFGAIYFVLEEYEKAKHQYLEGLALNPNNSHLLTDYATYFMVQYDILLPLSKESAEKHIESAIEYLIKSYNIDKNDQNTCIKLSNCYLIKNDCVNAWKYFNICRLLGGQAISQEYSNQLSESCKEKK
jgi:tetratricopeptide (TPR) repeat protein